MLPHQGHAEECGDGQAERHQPHTPKRFHERLDHALVPAVGQPLELPQVIANTCNHLGRARHIAEPLPQPRLENVLVHGRGDRDAQGGAHRAECVRRRRDDGLVRVVDGGDAREQRHGQHAAVARAQQRHGHEGYPGRRLVVQRARETDGDRVDQHHDDAETHVPARLLHDEAAPDGRHRDAQRGRQDAQAGLGGRVPHHLEVQRHVVQDHHHHHGAGRPR